MGFAAPRFKVGDCAIIRGDITSFKKFAGMHVRVVRISGRLRSSVDEDRSVYDYEYAVRPDMEHPKMRERQDISLINRAFSDILVPGAILMRPVEDALLSLVDSLNAIEAADAAAEDLSI